MMNIFVFPVDHCQFPFLGTVTFSKIYTKILEVTKERMATCSNTQNNHEKLMLSEEIVRLPKEYWYYGPS
jgi:hypothetical protein